MNKEQKLGFSLALCGALFVGAGSAVKISEAINTQRVHAIQQRLGLKESDLNGLEESIWRLQIESKSLKKENYETHIKLIQKGNPYNWEVWGDGLSGGYRRLENGSEIGSTPSYIYLEDR